MGNVSAQECAVRVVAPATVDIGVSTTFNVSIIAENVPAQGTPPGFYGWEFLLSWDAGVINCTTETLNLEIWGAGNYLGPWVSVPIDNVAGTYHQSLTGRAPGTPKTGTFWLANLTFQVLLGGGGIMSIAETDLNVAAFPPSTYCLATQQATQIPHEFIQAHVEIVPEFVQAVPLLVLMLASVASVILAKTWKKTK
jgi:hypothetical protein